MTSFVLFDDATARRFEPFALTRPCGELRAGALLVRERWAHVLRATALGHVSSPHLADFAELEAPPCLTDAILPAGTIVVNARCCPTLAALPDADVWRAAGQVAAVRLGVSIDAAALNGGGFTLDSLVPDGATTAEIDGWWLEAPWDLVRHLTAMLSSDIVALARSIDRRPTTGLTVLGEHAVVIEHGATIEPLVVFDASAGPILVRAGASVAAFTRLVGPTHIGPGTQVAGGKVGPVSIGEQCRVHGELSTTIFIGHANKGHDGFVGHSVLGRWCNLGASTVTSNLKNTYGSVHCWTPEGERDTGLQFLGTLLGDHAKTAIGTRLMTGSLVGAGANVVGGGHAPRVVAPFAFKDEAYRLDKFLEVAARVMARRHVVLGERERAHLARAHAARWSVAR